MQDGRGAGEAKAGAYRADKIAGKLHENVSMLATLERIKEIAEE